MSNIIPKHGTLTITNNKEKSSKGNINLDKKKSVLDKKFTKKNITNNNDDEDIAEDASEESATDVTEEEMQEDTTSDNADEESDSVEEQADEPEETFDDASEESDDISIDDEDISEETDANDELLEDETDAEEEETDDFLYEYSYDYSEEERSTYWKLINPPMVKQRTIIFTVVCAIIGIVGFVSGGNGLGIMMFILAAAWIGLPVAIYCLNFHKYCKKTSSLWLKKWKVAIYEAHVDFYTNKEDLRTYLYDDFYKIINYERKLYLVAGSKDIVIISKGSTPKEIIRALLELDITIQQGESEA